MQNQQSTESKFNPFFSIFTKLSKEINISILFIMLITGLTYFHIYNWHAGNLKYAIEREKLNLSSIGELSDSLNKNDLIEVKLIEKIVFNQRKESPDSSKFKLDSHLSDEEAESYIVSKISALNTMWLNSITVSIPFIGIKMVITDYIILLLYIGLLLYIWLFSKLSQLSYSLNKYLNDFSVDSKIDEIINSIFYPILPRSKFYKFFEIILITFISAFIIIIISNTYEIYINHHSYSQSLRDQPGWDKFKIYVRISYIITIFGTCFSIFLYYNTRKVLFDIRNLLMILRSIDSFWAALYQSFNKRDDPLLLGRNLIEYRTFKSSIDNELIISVQRKRTKQFDILHDKINLSKAFLKFTKQEKNIEIENYNALNDSFFKRPLTREEEIMKRFYIDLLTNDSNKNEISKRFLSITGESHSHSESDTERIRVLIINAQTEQAIQEALILTEQNKYKELRDDIISLSNKFRITESEYSKGTLSHQEYLKNITKVIDNLLSLLTKMDNK